MYGKTWEAASCPCPPVLPPHTAKVMSACARAARWRLVQLLLAEVEASEFDATQVTYNVAIRACRSDLDADG